jgi:hypothetical protein
LAPTLTIAADLPLSPHPAHFLMNGAKYSVTGSGTSYDAAYNDAQNRLPSGAQVVTLRSKQDGNTWYVTIYYN